MFQFILKRLLMVIPTFIAITLITFALVHLIPGDPIEIRMGERGLTPEVHAQMMAQLGLDLPLHEQYFNYIKGVFQGDLGNSFRNNEPVLKEFFTLFPATVELAFFALLWSLVAGILFGVIAAVKKESWLSHAISSISLTGYSMPIFWWGLILILYFSTPLGLPASGRLPAEYWIEAETGFMLIDTWNSDEPGAFVAAIKSLILPAIVLGTIPLAIITRMTRSSMLEVLGEDYIRTAKAKGLNITRIVIIHALRNALIPVVTVVGLIVGQLLSGAVLTENIFSWPGIGKWIIDAINSRDYPVLQGSVLIVATLIILVNLTVDLIYGVVNPRIRHT
ncbi:ABC transporter permease subunit [Glaesserella parasuis]|uniref:Peptide ABC transporter permease n=2 Tax=Glaesserella parasuis TaxID=738 RepID=A0A836MEU6_GLAPU|nr:ABC transporter permease subunit [Glaesserella parasuis]KDB48092.1 peptide ABC transporter permease [Glaesserella parasuis HPS10]KEZ15964.1 Dipeptide transport system permease protein dppB [Glaesserella parasuis]MCT8539930.1 ABC transporter permease subunit [Glaesserella parasuis]MCT8574496.1 ABC transporter permease subunit [Glaesserella parasuis]MCT8631854.1 ABC transporter permease subunit [Glaesserella parasuis]